MKSLSKILHERDLNEKLKLTFCTIFSLYTKLSVFLIDLISRRTDHRQNIRHSVTRAITEWKVPLPDGFKPYTSD